MAPLQTTSGTNNDEEPSDIQKFYEKSSIFVTGGSGFLGHLLIQKLIRDCPDLSTIYLMIRPKKGKSLEERFEEMLKDPVFERMKKESPNYVEKIQLIFGDLEKPGLGISEKDKILICEEVNIIFHLAATVRFNEKIKTAVAMNVRGTREIINLAKSMPNLKAFIHCSTAYSNCPRKDIDEVFYDMPESPDRLLQMTELLNDKELEILTSDILCDWPNTYSFTKGLAEILVKDEGQGLPIAVFRPSMVISTVSDPVGGWINNVYGPVGIVLGTGLGLIRVLQANPNCVGDTVPGDYVINNIIAAAYHVGTTFQKENLENGICFENDIKVTNSIPIFNCVSGPENPNTYGDVLDFGSRMIVKWASVKTLWHIMTICTTNLYLSRFLEFFLHTIPSYLMDFFLIAQGRKARMVKTYQKIGSFTNLLAYFATREWNFKNNNTQALWKNLNNTDKRIFPFSLKELDWEPFYMEDYPKGLRLYIVKDPLDTLPRALKRYQRLKYLHYTVVSVFWIIFAIILFQMFRIFM